MLHNQRPVSRKLLTTLLIVTSVLFLELLIIKPSWTGFTGKTLWKWMQLLIIPLALAAGGWLLSSTQGKVEREIASKSREQDLAIAEDNQHNTEFQAYIDRISELMLNKGLRTLKKDSKEVRNVARVWTLTVLSRLDGLRKGALLRFLYDAGLIGRISEMHTKGTSANKLTS